MAKFQWIPITEKLPEKVGEYLVSDMYENVYCSYFDYLKGKMCFLYEDNNGWGDLTKDNTVVAWMPLPKPYKTDKAE